MASAVFLWATPTAAFGAMVPTVVLFGLTALFALRYPGYVAGGWEPRRDLLFWGLLGTAATLVAAAAGAVVHALVGAALLVGTPVLVGGVRWFLRPDDAAILGDSDVAVNSAGVTAGETVSVATDVTTGLRSGRRALVALAGTVTAVLAVTALVSADYRATYAGYVALAAGFVPLVAFPVLGYAVTLPERADLRSVLVVATTASPWLAGFSLSVLGGTEPFGPLVVTSVWGIAVVLVGLLLFYGVLWVATWRS